jgi:imidazoleglycerol-phosphate dehydratase/histidinol-phosphatase
VRRFNGLGTDSFPEDTFWPTPGILRAFENEGILF